jgi:hypothetical protein
VGVCHLFIVHNLGFGRVFHALHAVSTPAWVAVFISPEAGSSASTSTGAFGMPSKSIASGKLTAALPALVWTFSSMQFHMALEVVQATESGITVHAFVWLFLTVCKQVTL